MVQKTTIDPASPAAKGYETPSFDTLRPRWQKWVVQFLKHGDEEQAALDAGYSPKSALVHGFEIGRHPQVVDALEELTNRRMNSAEFSRAPIIEQLRKESAVTMADLCFENENGKWKPLPIEQVAPEWRCCTGLVTVTREGNAQFNTSAQANARKLLASYMKWDKEVGDLAPPVAYDFGDLKGDPNDSST